MLITAGTKERGYNTMTASGGHLGSIWGGGKCRPSAVVYVRPQRYTYTLLEQAEAYSLAVLPSDNRAPLTYCGTHSGRDGDKLSAAALSVFYHEGTPCIEQAEFVIVCRKLHAVSFAPDQFTERSLLSYYTANDFHRQYIGEITAVLTKS
jgi:flavin reductase (DIM6/NTAB) family NADH-FMN oxidoreductase RutF